MRNVKMFYEKHKTILAILLLAVLLTLPFVGLKTLYVRHMCNILMYALLASSLNVINGYSGQTCLGQAGFFAIGAYTCAILSTRFHLSFWLLLIIGGVMAMIVGYLVSLPTLRLNGIYLSITTLGASEIIRIIAQTWTPVTGGATGIKSIPYPYLFGLDTFRPQYYYYIFLLLNIIFLLVTNRVLKSRVGRAWISIREDQIASKSLGVETNFYKSLNFMYGAFWAGIAGVAYAPFVNYIEASQFSTDTGFDVLAMVVLGGQGTLAGPILGSVVVTLLTETLRFLSNWRYVIYALLIIGMMWLRPQGLLGASQSMLAGGKIIMKKNKERQGESGVKGGGKNE